MTPVVPARGHCREQMMNPVAVRKDRFGGSSGQNFQHLAEPRIDGTRMTAHASCVCVALELMACVLLACVFLACVCV